jgi:tetratricopeptide (TPR) repeat protein
MTGKEDPKTTSEWFEYGRECFKQPDGVAAIDAFERVIDDDPGYRHPDGDNPYFYLGKIAEIEDRIDDAIIHFTRALAVDQGDEESRIGRGSCYTVRREHARAIEDFEKLLRMPDEQRKVPRKDLLYVIAENYRQMEEWRLAAHWGKLALEADPLNERHRALFESVSAKINAKA